LILKHITDYLQPHFENLWPANNVLLLKEKNVEVLKNPNFAIQIQDYFKQFYA